MVHCLAKLPLVAQDSPPYSKYLALSTLLSNLKYDAQETNKKSQVHGTIPVRQQILACKTNA